MNADKITELLERLCGPGPMHLRDVRLRILDAYRHGHPQSPDAPVLEFLVALGPKELSQWL